MFRKIVALLVIFALLVTTQTPGVSGAPSAIFHWLQTDWSGGADTVTFPHHPANQTGWTRFFGRDAGIDISAAGQLTLAPTTAFITQTNDTDFKAGTFNRTSVVGTGVHADVRLAVSTATFGARLANPAALPAGTGRDVTFSPCGRFLAVAHATSPFLSVYHFDPVAGTIGARLANPVTLPTGEGWGVSFSPCGRFLAVAHATSPFLSVYHFDPVAGTIGTRLANATPLPPGTGRDVTFSPCGRFLAVAHLISPFLSVYHFDPAAGTIGARLANPADLPAGTGRDVTFSPCGRFLAVAHDAGPRLSVYHFNLTAGTIGARLANPADLPAGDSYGVSFSPCGRFLAVGHESSPFLSVYHFDPATGTIGARLALPVAPAGVGRAVTFSPCGRFLAVGHSTTPFLSVYHFDPAAGTIGARLANPVTLPTGEGWGVSFSPCGRFLAVGHSTTPFLSVYRFALVFHTSGNFTSSAIDTGQASNYTTLNFTITRPAGTDLRFQLRTATTSAELAAAPWRGPDGTALTNYTVSGTTINPVHDGHRWIQYRAFFSTTNTSVTSTLSNITINFALFPTSASLTSSPYNTGNLSNALTRITWSQSLPAGTAIRFQVRTSPNNIVWTPWAGPDNGVAGTFSTTTFFTDPTGGQAIDADLNDRINDQWIQYRVWLDTTNTAVTPTLLDVNLTYIFLDRFVDTIPPTFSHAGHNQVFAGSPTLFHIRYDDHFLHPRGQWIFATNNTGVWLNDTPVNWTATPQWANVTRNLNSTVGVTIGYRWFARDNATNWNSTPIYTLTTILDNVPPTFSHIGHDHTAAGRPTLFHIRYDDNAALHPRGQWIFSTNNTGVWVNDTPVNWTATPQWANVTRTLNSTVGLVIGYKWFAFDNAGNWNSMPIHTLTTTPYTGYYRHQADLELEFTNLTISCGIDSRGNRTCHVLTVAWPTPAPARGVGWVTPYPHPHPDANRSPAGFYPLFVHRQHGGTNWPEWGSDFVADGRGHLTPMPGPWGGRLIRGWADTIHGMVNGTGTPTTPATWTIVSDIAFRRTRGEADEGSYAYTHRPFRATPRGELEPGLGGRPGVLTCSPVGPNYGWGCHGYWVTGGGGLGFRGARRLDAINCTTCHRTVPLNHGGVTSCDRCHNTTAGNVLSGNNPITLNCTVAGCHPGNVTRFMHAGFDCRHCHGHGHRVSDFNYTYRAGTGCGDGSIVCHGPGADFPVPSVTHNVTAGVAGPTCRQCHAGPGFAGAHNITIPRCDECHNRTTTWGAARTNASVPDWNMNRSATNIHGNTSAEGGRNGTGLNCTACHGNTSYHSRPSTITNCLDTRCHGIGGAGQRINQTHSNLSCQACHNNLTIRSVTGNLTTINTNVHATWTSRLIPFGIRNLTLTSAECRRCHGNITDPNCFLTGCHDNVSGEIHMAWGGLWTDIVPDGRHEPGHRNCTECHWRGAGAKLRVDNVSFAMGMHAGVRHVTLFPTNDPINHACRACHGEEGLYANPAGHYNRTWIGRNCTFCHVTPPLWRNATRAVEHIQPGLANDTWLATSVADGCLACHDNDLIPHNDTIGTWLSNVSHYGRRFRTFIDTVGYNVTMRQGCVYCHLNATKAARWGNATLIDRDFFPLAHNRSWVNNSDCWPCHIDGNVTVDSFHNISLNPGYDPNCTACHFSYSYMRNKTTGVPGWFNSTTARLKFVNETMYRASEHGNFTIINCSSCHTNASTPAGHMGVGSRVDDRANITWIVEEYQWKWCDSCHVFQADPRNETDRHNVTGRPQNSFINVSGVRTSVMNITDCTVCHNATSLLNARTIFNSRAARNCRDCHTFPDRTYW